MQEVRQETASARAPRGKELLERRAWPLAELHPRGPLPEELVEGRACQRSLQEEEALRKTLPACLQLSVVAPESLSEEAVPESLPEKVASERPPSESE